MSPSQHDKDKPPPDSAPKTNPKWEELREQLERVSWTIYVRTKYSGREIGQDRGQEQGAVGKSHIKSLHEINQRIEELARQYETTVPGESRRESIADEISELQRRLQSLYKKFLAK